MAPYYCANRKLKSVVLISLLIVISLAGSGRVMAQEPDQLPIAFPVQTEELVDYFNQVARPEDIASVPLRSLHLLPDITSGRRMVLTPSLAQAREMADQYVGQAEYLGYDMEHWDHTPQAEKDNLIAAVQQAAEFAHSQGMVLVVSPDRRFSRQYAGQMAPYVDIFLIQAQRLQQDPNQFAAWVEQTSATVRANNPDVEIYVQVSATWGASDMIAQRPAQMITALQAIPGLADGIAIWSMPPTQPVLAQFISLLRPQAIPTVESTLSPSPTVLPPTLPPSPTLPPPTQPSPTATANPSPSLEKLPVGIEIDNMETVAYVNRTVRADDLVLVPIDLLSLLPEIQNGKKVVIGSSLAGLEQIAAEFDADYLGYRPVALPETPLSEQENLADAIRRAAELAQNHDMKLLVNPDPTFAIEYTEEIAADVDIFVIQAQRYQHNPDEFVTWIQTLSQLLRTENPNIKLYIQVSTVWGDTEQIFMALQALEPGYDGILIGSSPYMLEEVDRLLDKLRTSPPDPTPSPTLTPTATQTPQPETRPTASPVENIPPDPGPGRNWLLWAIFIVSNILMLGWGGVVGFMVGRHN